MKANVGKIDKVIRVIIAIFLFSSFFFLEGNLRFISLVGLIPLLTGMVSFCPLYRLLGVNSCRAK